MRFRSCATGLLACLALLGSHGPALAQGRGGQPAGPPPTGKAGAPIDLTGYWVSIIVDEWRFRVTPVKGDILYMPLNAQARQAANAWDPAKDEAEGNECKAYGAVGVVQRPGRIHITWQDDNTLRMDFDAGTQTRLLHFGPPPQTRPAPSLQGYSAARWDLLRGRGGVPAPSNVPGESGTLRVTTTSMLPGYLRKNGVPYSANAVLNESINRIKGAAGDVYMIITAIVEDPANLVQPFVRTYQFKKLPDSSGWDPSPCWTR